MRTETRRQRQRTRTGEEGSAYIAVLVVLVVLTIFGLALSLITQTEMQVGSNERTVSRVFYAADAGIEAAIAKALVSRDFGSRTYTYTDSGLQVVSDGTVHLGAQVEVSDLYQVQEGPCNLCEINQSGGYGGKDFKKVAYIVNATASRFAALDADRTPLAQKTLSAIVQMEPFEPAIESLKTINDPDALAKIKF